MAKLVPDELVRGMEGMKSSEDLTNEAKNKKMKEVGMSDLPIDDLEDAVIVIAEFVNDVNEGSGVMGYIDNIPLLIKAWAGKENILPQADDLDPIEKERLQNTIKEKLNLDGDVEDIINDGVEILYLGNRMRQKIANLRGTDPA